MSDIIARGMAANAMSSGGGGGGGTTVDAYSKNETDNLLRGKANASDVYTSQQTDDLLDDKVNKVSGKGLSTNDYTNEDMSLVKTITKKANTSDVTNLQNQINETNGNVQNIVSDVTTLKNDTSTAKGNISTIQNDINNLKTKDSELQTAINNNTTAIEKNKTDISSRLPWRYGIANAGENTNKWYRLGRFETTTANNTFNSMLLVHDRKGRENGILTITIEKKNDTETGLPSAFVSDIKGEWISAETQTNSTFQKRNNFVIVAWVEDTKLICELWCKIYQAWNIYYALQLVNNRMATDVSKITSNPESCWVLESTSTPYDSYPLASDTVRVVQTSDKLAEALAKINDFDARILALEESYNNLATAVQEGANSV